MYYKNFLRVCNAWVRNVSFEKNGAKKRGDRRTKSTSLGGVAIS
jgi:hypothetical protein